MRQPDGSSVAPPASGPGTSRFATTANTTASGRTRSDLRDMGRRGCYGSLTFAGRSAPRHGSDWQTVLANGRCQVVPPRPAVLTGFIFHLIPHTHWDREWYLPRGAFQVRLVPVLDDLIELLRGDPSYRSFLLDGQTVLLEDYLRARPEREADIRALVKTGRLQVGPWYVLADELIPSGEALVRNLLLGAADAERWGGRLDGLYSPDAFGHPAVLPSVARGFGMRYAVAWRGAGPVAGQEGGRHRWGGAGGEDGPLWEVSPARHREPGCAARRR